MNGLRSKPTSRRPEIQFRVDFSATCAVAPAKIDLLEAIRESGSLSQGARHIGMSYRRARQLIDSFKGAFRNPVTRAVRGGSGGGGVVLTPFGEELVDSYRSLEVEIRCLATRRLEAISAAARRGTSRKAAGGLSPGKTKRRSGKALRNETASHGLAAGSLPPDGARHAIDEE